MAEGYRRWKSDTFSHFDTVHTYDEQTDGRTDRPAVAYTALTCNVSRGKKLRVSSKFLSDLKIKLIRKLN